MSMQLEVEIHIPPDNPHGHLGQGEELPDIEDPEIQKATFAIQKAYKSRQERKKHEVENVILEEEKANISQISEESEPDSSPQTSGLSPAE